LYHLSNLRRQRHGAFVKNLLLLNTKIRKPFAYSRKKTKDIYVLVCSKISIYSKVSTHVGTVIDLNQIFIQISFPTSTTVDRHLNSHF